MSEKKDPFILNDRITYNYKTGCFVGGYLSHEAMSYLRLLALYEYTTVQAILQKIVNEWVSDKKPKEKIIEVLVDRAFVEWQRRKKEGIQQDIEEYIEEIRIRLCKRKIEKKNIDCIIEKLKQRGIYGKKEIK